MASRLNLARLGAAVLGASVALVLSAALPANAAGGHGAPGTSTPGSTPSANSTVATVEPQTQFKDGTGVWVSFQDNGKTKEEQAPTALIALRLSDNSTVYSYCVELTVALDSSLPLVETGWSQYPDSSSAFNTNNQKINWILHNSFPTIGADLLSANAGLSKSLTQSEAITATQAAIWHFSDGATYDTTKNTDAQITALYNYLINKAQNLPQPANAGTAVADPKLSIDPPATTDAKPGSLVGPYTVDTNVGQVDLSSTTLPNGVKLTDASGNAIDPTKIANGTKIYIDIPANAASGSASFTLSDANDVGNLFVASTNANNPLQGKFQTHGVRSNCGNVPPDQAQIIAQAPVSASVNVRWTAAVVSSSSPTPTPSVSTPTPSTTTTTPAVVAPTTTVSSGTGGGQPLPYTGVSIVVPVALAIVLIGAGGTFLILQRRRRRA